MFSSEFLLKFGCESADVSSMESLRRSLRRLCGAIVVITVLSGAMALHGASAKPAATRRTTAASARKATKTAVRITSRQAPTVKTTVHTVAAGETLTAIAARYNTTVGTIARLNRLTSADRLRVGQKVVVPRPPDPLHVPAKLARRPERLQFHARFRYWAERNSIPADLLMATTYLESGWNNTKVSSTGAIGIGQLMPETSRYIMQELIGMQLDPTDPEHNIRMSARYIRQLLKGSGGDVEQALWRYYQGAGSIAKNGVYAQTKTYARDVMALRHWFR